MDMTLYRKGFRQITPVASDITVATAGVQSIYFLNKDYLTEAWKMDMTFTQQFTGVAPTGFNVATAILNAQLEFSGGRKGGNGVAINLSGTELVNLMRFTEAPQASVFSGGNITTTPAVLVTTVHLHTQFDAALNDLMSARFTADYSQITLTINWGTSVFTGGTTPGALNIANSIKALAYPRPDKMIAGANGGSIGAAKQVFQSSLKTPSGAGSGDDMLLKTGSLVRFIGITTDVGGVADDGVVGNIQLLFHGINYQASFLGLKLSNILHRSGWYQPGMAVIDFGDDPSGFLDLSGVNEARMQWTALKAGNVRFSQVTMEQMGN